jgi:flagellar motor switch protein FliG
MAVLNSTLSKKEPNFIFNKDNMKEIKMIKNYIQHMSDIIAKYEMTKNPIKRPVGKYIFLFINFRKQKQLGLKQMTKVVEQRTKRSTII